MSGRATLMMVMSTRSMNVPRQTATSVHQRFDETADDESVGEPADAASGAVSDVPFSAVAGTLTRSMFPTVRHPVQKVTRRTARKCPCLGIERCMEMRPDHRRRRTLGLLAGVIAGGLLVPGVLELTLATAAQSSPGQGLTLYQAAKQLRAGSSANGVDVPSDVPTSVPTDIPTAVPTTAPPTTSPPLPTPEPTSASPSPVPTSTPSQTPPTVRPGNSGGGSSGTSGNGSSGSGSGSSGSSSGGSSSRATPSSRSGGSAATSGASAQTARRSSTGTTPP